MKRILILTTTLAGMALPALAQEVNVLGWGGAYSNSQIEAYHKPFTAKTGIKVVSIDADNPATPIKALVEAKIVSIDVASIDFADAVRFCDEGLLESIDPAVLTAAPDGTAAIDDFLPGTVTDCFVATDVF
ncbi:MAG: ABC transporter substrate-binding protein, partial [Paracoccaceae bacterium]|nr:ABC transporter substrate-binding protein [Paracoccaceae bacterium]